MDRIINTKTDQKSIYEIYRACRLCGAGAGYKMPIIQNVVDLDTNGIELAQKIRDCVQIEVHPDDKMPPLICELCVDKVNDFCEFIELCQRTNKQTRMRLGLPPQISTRAANSDASSTSGDCILGVTEPVYQNEDSDEPLAPVTRRSKQNESKHKVIKKENPRHVQKENVSKQKRPPTPPRTTRLSKPSNEDSMSLSKLKQQVKKPPSKVASPPQPKSILKRERDKQREESPAPTRSKRPREPPKPEVSQKKVKLSAPTSTPTPAPKPYKPGPRSRRAPSPPPPPPPPPSHSCRICGRVNTTPQALSNHLRSHTVLFTNVKMACNACQLWFGTLEEANSHHKWHRDRRRAYRCKRCGSRHGSLASYTGHIDKNECLPWEEVPDKKCSTCWKLFPTETILDQHHCGGEDVRPGGKCSKCRRLYALLKNLKKHETTCTHKKKGTIKVDPEVQASLMPAQVRVSRCDALLTRVKREHIDVADVTQNYGLDRSCVYPYLCSYSVKSELPKDSMVKIKAEIDEFEEHDYIHWDSEESDSESKTTVDSLSTLSLKKIFSKDCLGKVPRKRRRIKFERNAFDSLLNASDFDNTLNRDINNIIDNLNNDNDWCNDKNDDDNGSEEESLLSNYVLFDTATSSDKVNDVENSNDSQSILDTNKDGKYNDGVNKANDTVNSTNNYDTVKSNNDTANSTNNDDTVKSNNDKANSTNNDDTVNSNNDTLKSTNDNDMTLDKESSADSEKNVEDQKSRENTNDEETKTENAESIVNSKENNDESYKINDSNVDSELINDDKRSNDGNLDRSEPTINDAKLDNHIEDFSNVNESTDNPDDLTMKSKDNHNEESCNENESAENQSNDTKIESNDDIESSTETRNDSKKENTNNDNVNAEIDDAKMDCSEDNSVNVRSENISHDVVTDINTENINKENNAIESKEIIPNNDSGNTNNDNENTNNSDENTNSNDKNNDNENTNNDTDSPNNGNIKVNDSSLEKIVNGETEEQAEKLGFGDMNDISDTEVDDKKLMDALNEHIGEQERSSESVNSEIVTQYNKENNDESELSIEQNGPKNEVPKSFENTTDVNHKIISNDYENAINDLISENNDTATENNGRFSKDVVSQSNDHKNEINDFISENNDTATENNDTFSKDIITESIDKVLESRNRGNDCETDKISLEDLLPPKSDNKSMDLDSISDDDFDFDSC